MSRLLRRISREQMQAEVAREVAEILLEVGEPLPEVTHAFVAGDPIAMRGLPSEGFGGAMRGTRPERNRRLDDWSGRA